MPTWVLLAVGLAAVAYVRSRPAAGAGELAARAAAVAAFRARTGRDGAVRALRAERWADASLGVRAPGVAYALVETPGYVVEVVDPASGQAAEYHCDQRGRCVLCPPCTAALTRGGAA